jgi:hypothetical protein
MQARIEKEPDQQRLVALLETRSLRPPTPGSAPPHGQPA